MPERTQALWRYALLCGAGEGCLFGDTLGQAQHEVRAGLQALV